MKTNYVYLHTLPPGSRFRTESGKEGVLLYANPLRARVKYGSDKTRSITKKRAGLNEAGEQETVTFDVTTPAEQIDIAANTEVEVVERGVDLETAGKVVDLMALLSDG